MGCIGISVLLLIAALIAASYGQCIRIRNGSSQSPCGQPPCGQPPCGQPPCCPPPSCGPCSYPCACGTSVDDLTTILAIVRALEEKETPKPGISNAEEIILQLVNALVFATTQNSGCNKGTGVSIPPVSGTKSDGTGVTGGNVGGNNVGSGSNTSKNGATDHPGGTPNKNTPDNGLITLDLLQSGSESNPTAEHLVRLGLAGKKILDVGLGGHDDSQE